MRRITKNAMMLAATLGVVVATAAPASAGVLAAAEESSESGTPGWIVAAIGSAIVAGLVMTVLIFRKPSKWQPSNMGGKSTAQSSTRSGIRTGERYVTVRVAGGGRERVSPTTVTSKPHRVGAYTAYWPGGDINGVYFGSGYYAWPFWNDVVDDDRRSSSSPGGGGGPEPDYSSSRGDRDVIDVPSRDDSGSSGDTPVHQDRGYESDSPSSTGDSSGSHYSDPSPS